MKILKNYLYNVSYQLLRIILPIITMPYIARVLGPDAVGEYAVSAAYVNYFVIFGMVGLDVYGTRQIAYVRDDNEKIKNVFWEINLLKGVCIIISTLIYYISICIFFNKNLTLYLIQVLALVASFFDVSWFFSGKEEFKKTAIRNIIVKLTGVILIFVFVHKSSDLLKYALIISGSTFVGQAVMWIDLKNVMFPIPNIVKKNIIVHFKHTIKLWIPSLAVSVYTSLDKVMLGILSTNYQVGIYDYSQNIVKVLSTVTTTLATVTAPRAANFIERNNEIELKKLFYNSMRIITFISLPIVGGVIGIRNSFVYWFLGNKYLEVSDLLLFSAWIILPISWSQLIGNQILIAKKMEREYTIAIVGGALTNFIVNLMLIKFLQARGVLIASVAAETMVLLLMIYLSHSLVDYGQCFQGTLKYALLSFVMSIVVYYVGGILDKTVVTTILQVVVGIIVYVCGLIILKDRIVLNVLAAAKSKLIKMKGEW